MTTSEINWAAYSEHYDLLCESNDAYSEIVDAFIKFCRERQLSNDLRVVDLGAGTGNFTLKMTEYFSEGQIFHVDANEEMNKIANAKYDRIAINKPIIIESEVQSIEFPEKSIDLIVCVNALYAMQPQLLVLRKIYDWLKPGGLFYIIDLGRPMDARDWGLHFLKTAARQRWLLKYIRDSFRAREVIKQNKITTLAQESGRYWTHDTNEFGNTLEGVGFTVETLHSCYRGYADLAICRR